MSIFEIEETVAAFAGAALLQILEEGVVGRVTISDHLYVDLLLVFDIKDYISVLLIFLDPFVDRLADVCYGYSWRLKDRKKKMKYNFIGENYFFSFKDNRIVTVDIGTCENDTLSFREHSSFGKQFEISYGSFRIGRLLGVFVWKLEKT